MATGLKEVSQLACVSISTVSQILSGRTQRYSKETQERVLAAAKQLDYTPNPISQALRTSRTKTIGIIMHGITEQIQIIEELASKRGYQMLLAFTKWETTSDMTEIRNLLHRKVDGLLLLSPPIDSTRNEAIEELVRKNFPVVGIGVSLAKDMDYVDWDRYSAYKKLTEHLLSRGCRRFLFLHTADTPAVAERVRGIQAALSETRGTEFQNMYSKVSQPLPGPAEQTIASGWPQAVICHSDLLAIAAMKAAIRHGKKIPADMAITGCSDMIFSEFLDVPLTTIRMPMQQMVSIAMERLFERIENPNSQFDHFSAIIQPELVMRESDKFSI